MLGRGAPFVHGAQDAICAEQHGEDCSELHNDLNCSSGFRAQRRCATHDIPEDAHPESEGSHVAVPTLIAKDQHHFSSIFGAKCRRVRAEQQTVDALGAHAGLSPISFLRRAARTIASSRRASARTTDRPSCVSR